METFWKEYTVTLPCRKEYIFDIQNKKTNCVFIQNHNITNVFAGTKPHLHEIEIPPSRSSIIIRPFPIEYIYLFADKQTPITIVETVTQNPVASFIQQKVTKNVSIETTNTIIQNTPLEICQLDALNRQIKGQLVWPPYVHRTEFIYDLGNYRSKNVNIVLFHRIWSHPRDRTKTSYYQIYCFDINIPYILLAKVELKGHRRWGKSKSTLFIDNVKLLSLSNSIAYLSLNNIIFRYLSIIGTQAPFFTNNTIPSIVSIIK